MRRRLLTAGLCCAALAGTAPVPVAIAQDATSSAPGQVDPASGAAPASTGAPASSAAPGSGVLPAGTPATSTATPPTTAAPAPTTSAVPGSTAAPAGVSGQTPGSSSDDHTTAIVLLALVGALLALAALLWGAARWWAWEPMWWIRWRHATAEAGWRTSAAWAEFRDWMRLGR